MCAYLLRELDEAVSFLSLKQPQNGNLYPTGAAYNRSFDTLAFQLPQNHRYDLSETQNTIDSIHAKKKHSRHQSSRDNYFESTVTRSRSISSPGQSNHSFSSNQKDATAPSATGESHSRAPLFLVEFKAGRSDLFYISTSLSPSMCINIGDLVLVEADRGQDLGRVKIANIMHPAQIELQSSSKNSQDLVQRDSHPKLIHRLAVPNEISMLEDKLQDEAKAMMLCQSKVRQRELNMEVVDAEFQWYDLFTL